MASPSLPQRVGDALAAAGQTAKTPLDALAAVVAVVCREAGLRSLQPSAGEGSPLQAAPGTGALFREACSTGGAGGAPSGSDGPAERELLFAAERAAKELSGPTPALQIQLVQGGDTVFVTGIVVRCDRTGDAMAGPFGAELDVKRWTVAGGTDAPSLLAPLWDPSAAKRLTEEVANGLIQPASAVMLAACADAAPAGGGAASRLATGAAGAGRRPEVWSVSQVPRATGKRSSPALPGFAAAEPLPTAASRRSASAAAAAAGRLDEVPGAAGSRLSVPVRGPARSGPLNPDLEPGGGAFVGMGGAGPGPMGIGGGFGGGGGMLVGPGHPGFGMRGMGGLGGAGGVGGARFDPVGPPGTGPGTGRGGRASGRGGLHRDLLQPPGWDGTGGDDDSLM